MIPIRDHYANQEPWEMRVQHGLVSRIRRLSILGHNRDVDTATIPEDIWEGGGLYPFQATAQDLEVVSDSAADAAAGTGLRTLRVEGLDADWAEQTEDVTLNGTTPVALTKKFLRVNYVTGLTAGTGLTNAGTILTRVASAGATLAHMEPGDGRAMQAIYSVAAGKNIHFMSREVCVLRETAALALEINIMHRRPHLSEPWVVRSIIGLQAQGTSSLIKPLPFVEVPEKSDFRATVVVCTANNVGVSLTFEGIVHTDGIG